MLQLMAYSEVFMMVRDTNLIRFEWFSGVALSARLRACLYVESALIMRVFLPLLQLPQETETAEGRTSFYNEYGIVRDVVQNHMVRDCRGARSLHRCPYGSLRCTRELSMTISCSFWLTSGDTSCAFTHLWNLRSFFTHPCCRPR